MILTQTLAVFYDAYRGLRARKMFWIVLILSGLVVALFAAIGIDENGSYFFGWRVTSSPNTRQTPAAAWYKYLFTTYGLGVWLTWIAAILALISTAGIFPEFMTRGSIDLVLCKPIGRVRLFLTQYAAGLLFVVLQVLVFCLASFLLIGIRGGEWEPALFVAVPLVVCFFSYLFSVCVFWGVVTRSTVAAILLTLVVWFLVWGLHTAETGLLSFGVMEEQKSAYMERGIEFLEGQADELEKQASTQPTEESDTSPAELREKITWLESRRRDSIGSAEKSAKVRRVLYRIKTFLPKTSETVALTERTLIRLADLPVPKVPERPMSVDDDFDRPDPGAAGMALLEKMRGRSVAWILGTSLAFEVVVLAFAAWIFRRRDF